MNTSLQPIQPHDEIKSLLAPYALHALEEDDVRVVEAHLATCAQCGDELADLLETASMIALTEIEAPPLRLWGRIESGMRADEQVDPGQSTKNVTQGPAPRVISLDQERVRRRGSLRTAFVGAVAAAAVLVPITAFVVQPGTPSIAALANRAAKSSGARRLSLEAADKTNLGEVILDADGHGYFRSQSLAELPEGKTYQLWTIVDGTPVSVGVLGRSPKTSAFTADNRIQAVAVSVENASGAVSPSTPIGVASFS